RSPRAGHRAGAGGSGEPQTPASRRGGAAREPETLPAPGRERARPDLPHSDHAGARLRIPEPGGHSAPRLYAGGALSRPRPAAEPDPPGRQRPPRGTNPKPVADAGRAPLADPAPRARL